MNAQSVSNFRNKKISYKSISQRIDSLSIVPGSFKIVGVADSLYRLDEITSTLYWLHKPPLIEFLIQYRVFPISFSKSTNRISFDTVMYKFLIQKEKVMGPKDIPKPFDFGKISSNGSLGRSLSFGNRQDAVLNSSLNLQMNGYIGDSILLAAAISDNNIPIQPDGNTQNLKEFDQVFLKFSKDQWKLSLGDLDIRQANSSYLNFYKRLQGVSFENISTLSKSASNAIMASGAVAKGKFTRNVFQGVEGNQGPYRLKGANQEMFFIVLAGSERIYIDGVQQQRGEDQDYVINYNTAEVTFTSKQMITKDKRIQIEFEYADRNYLNSQFLLTDEFTLNKNFKLRFGFFDNTDAKNSPIGQTLNAEQKNFLAGVGDNLNGKYYSSATPDDYSLGKLLYKKMDSLYAPGKHDTIYVHVSKPENNLYSLSFIDLGDTKGNYVQDLENNSNGKVYKWISPDPLTGKMRGRFEPIILLAAPKAQKMISLGSTWNLSYHTLVDADIAFSKYDLNRLSAKDKSNDDGVAFKTSIKNEHDFFHKKYKFFTDASYDYASLNFKPIERLRDVEFYRDWGLDLQVTPAEEKILQTKLSINDTRDQQLKYSFENFTRTNEINSNKNAIVYHFSNQSWRMDHQFDIRHFNGTNRSGIFVRPTFDIAKKFVQLKNYELGLRFHQEKNESHWLLTDSLYAGSFFFNTLEAYTRSDQRELNKWGLKYYTRTDQLPIGKQFLKGDQSHNVNIDLQLLESDHHQFKLNTTWRMLNMASLQNSQPKKSNMLLGRAQYLMDVWRNAITGDVLYEVGSGQEPRRDFAYIEVPAGQGEYTWIDYNSDGIQQLTEFEIAKFKDQAKYFRISTPTSEFIRADYVQNNFDVVLDPAKALKLESNAFTTFLKRLYIQTSMQLSEKRIAGERRLLLPINNVFSDTTVIAYDELISNTLSFNKASQVWGIDINTFQTSNRAFLSYGYESRKNNLLSIRLHAYFIRVFTADLIYKHGNNDLQASKFSNRNYAIEYSSFEPRLTFVKGTNLRLVGGLKFDQKTNVSNEKMQAKAFIMEAKYNIIANTSISSKLTLNTIKYNAVTNSLLSYIMLDGLMPGKNVLWTLDLTKRLSRFLEMSLQYEGRKAGTSGMVNIGRAQIRAIL